MGDINCRRCGEPWDTYHLRHEREGRDFERVMSGDGCPSCDWGDAETAGPDRAEDHFRSLMDGTDEDPLKYL